MNINFKRTISVGLCLILLMTLVPISVFATTSIYNLQGTLTQPIVNVNSSASLQFQLTTPLLVGDEITVDFPSEFIIPSAIPVADFSISLNDVEVSNGLAGVSVTSNMVSLSLNTDIAVTDAVYLSFTGGANIITPQVAGSYDINLSTTKDPIPVAFSTDIYSQVADPVVSVHSSHIKKEAAYEIVFRTGDTVLSVLDGSLGDTISINFPNETVLPSAIANSTIKVNGVSLNQGTVQINTAGGGKAITFTLPSTLKILRNSYVQIEIAKEAGIKNPSVASSLYFLQVWTSKDSLPINSAYYAIIDSVITVPDVTVTPSIIGQKGAYFIKFKTSSEGNLGVNNDRIYVLFPINTTVPSAIAKGNILVNNVALTYDPIITNDPAITNDVLGRYQMEFLVPTGIPADSEVNIEINPNANILHPSNKGNYSLTVWTSQDMVWNQSAEYIISEAVNGVNAWVSPDIAGQIGQYSVALENGSNLLDINDTITILFPADSVLSKTNIADYIYLDGQKNTGTVSVNQSARTVTITLTKQINPGQVLNILLTQEAGIENPLKQGDYQLQIKTSKDAAYQYSNIYSIKGNHIINLSAQLNNNGTGLSGEYLIQFTVSSLGGLLGGLDTITIIFPEGTTLPNGGFSYTNIKVNDKPLDKGVIIFPSKRLLTLTLPKDVNVYQNSTVKVDILSTANIKNPLNVGNYNLLVYSSRDPVAMESNLYSIGMQTTSATVSISPNIYQSPAQYAVGFYTSSIGELSGSNNDYVEILFPVGTSVPASIAYSYVTINGKTAKSVQVSQQSVKIYLPNGMIINANGYVGVVISASVGIRNPSSSNYNLKVRTSKDTSYVLSQSYTTYGTAPTTSYPPGTTPSTSTSQVSVELDTYLAGEFAQYTIKYKTSSTGALRSGMDEITIVFNPKVEIPDYISKELIKVNGVQLNTGWVRRFNQSIIFYLPTTVEVKNNQEITITIDKRAEIRNPLDAGSYLLYVKTSMDSVSAEDYYTIEGESIASRFMVTPQINADGRIIKYSMKYTTNATGTLKGGYDWITLSLPTVFTQGQIVENIKIRLNGYLLDKEMIQVSGKNLMFILPSQINIAANSDVEIVIEDENYLIMPNLGGTFMLYISTSKDSNLLASNPLQAVVFNADERVISDGSDSQGNNSSGGQSNQGSGGSEGSGYSMYIKLYLDKTEASVNGEKYTLEAPPTAINGTTMIPLRFITEVLGGEVDYRIDQKRIIIVYNGQYLIFTIGSNTVYTFDDTITLPQAPKAVNGRTLVPLRFIAEWMNLYLDYNNTDKSIVLKRK